MRKLTLSTTLAAVFLASAGVASFAQTATAPADGNAAGMQGMSGGGSSMAMGNTGMMPMMMAMMPMMMPMPMGGGSMAGMPAAPGMAPTGDQAVIDAKLNLLITSIETLTKRIDALEAKSAN